MYKLKNLNLLKESQAQHASEESKIGTPKKIEFENIEEESLSIDVRLHGNGSFEESEKRKHQDFITRRTQGSSLDSKLMNKHIIK